MNAAITKQQTSDIRQQIAVKSMAIDGFRRDLKTLYRHPEYRSDWFNEELITREIEHLERELIPLKEELKRRFIP